MLRFASLLCVCVRNRHRKAVMSKVGPGGHSLPLALWPYNTHVYTIYVSPQDDSSAL